MREIPAADLARACRTISNDDVIADYFCCPIEVVRLARQSLPENQLTVRAAIPVRPQEDNPLDEPQDWSMVQERIAVKEASFALLCRQLETGQHWLNREDFLKVVRLYGFTI